MKPLTVAQLIAQLEKFPPDTYVHVAVDTEDQDTAPCSGVELVSEWAPSEDGEDSPPPLVVIDFDEDREGW